MIRHLAPFLLPLALLAGCAPLGEVPSLERRAAESIDPRVPVADRSLVLAADPQLAAELAGLRSRARAAAADAEPAIDAAESRVAAAGARESESWIAAQQSISAAIAARAPFTQALGDLDRLIAERIRNRTRLVPQDLAAAQAVADELAAVDRGQSERLDSLQRRLQR